MLYIGYLIILDGQGIKKISFGNFHFRVLRPENCIYLGSSSILLIHLVPELASSNATIYIVAHQQGVTP